MKKTVKSKVAKGPMKKKPVKSKDVKGAMKKPAAATSKVAKGHMKKPAAATSKSKAALIDLEDDSQSETRDRMKNYYFQEQLKNDTLDPELRDLWDKVRGNRKNETMLVNGIMVKVANGKFKPDKDSPQFQEFHSKITKNFWKDEHKGIPESLAIVKFKGLKFLMEALARGDVKETIDQGQKFYSWRTITIGKAGSSSTSRTVSKKGAIDEQSDQRLSGLLSKVGWSFNFSSKHFLNTEEGKPLPKTLCRNLRWHRRPPRR